MLMPYGQKEGYGTNSIDINALRAKEKTKFKPLLIFGNKKSSLPVLQKGSQTNLNKHN